MSDTASDTSLSGRIRACGVLPVVALPDPTIAVLLARTLVNAGIPSVEVTFRAQGAPQAIAAIRAEMPTVLVAAGTVLTVGQAGEALDAGAEVIVTPGTSVRVVEYVLARDALIIPGVATPSDILMNLDLGITLQKLFPAGVLGGVAFLRAIYGPFPGVMFMPTGGISAATLGQYLREPNVLACGGTWIASPKAIASHDWIAIGKAAHEAALIAREVRTSERSGSDSRGADEAGAQVGRGS
jgi:2-dehydro-3-deoxyphosphogluconate aldolase/(4S)-4-hydroxy-2-oxoglutarate aldolase